MAAEMHFRPGVDLRLMSTQTLFAWQCAAVACERFGVKCEASGVKYAGTKEEVGFHYNGNAIDIGMAHVPGNIGWEIWNMLEKWIGRSGGGQFDVVNELRPGSSPKWTGPHIHIEFDPKEK